MGYRTFIRRVRCAARRIAVVDEDASVRASLSWAAARPGL